MKRSPAKSKGDQFVEQLTQEALDAAQKGRWDQVIACYARRTQHGSLKEVSPETAKKLLACDQWMVERVNGVHGALRQQILDVQDQRRKLVGVKRQYGIQESGEMIHHLQTI